MWPDGSFDRGMHSTFALWHIEHGLKVSHLSSSDYQFNSQITSIKAHTRLLFLRHL
jgi:hypothetical protein